MQVHTCISRRRKSPHVSHRIALEVNRARFSALQRRQPAKTFTAMATSKALALPCVVALWLTSGLVLCAEISFSAQVRAMLTYPRCQMQDELRMQRHLANPGCMQVADSLSYFALQAEAALPKVQALQASVASGSLTAAKEAYVAARSEYEQIEVLAPSFAGIDCAIDCRACALLLASTLVLNSWIFVVNSCSEFESSCCEILYSRVPAGYARVHKCRPGVS